LLNAFFVPPILSVQHLGKSFGDAKIVRDISFDVNQGEIFGLLGPNGAGKTTTIQMILGIISPDAGEIELFGKSFKHHREEILKQCNFSSSYISLPWNLTVEENLSIFARLYEVDQAQTRIDQLLERLDFTKWRKTKTGKLSSGQLTRLLLIKALLNRPRFLLLDEPTASLDPDIADRTRQLLKQLVRDEATTILYTSHDMAEVEDMCNRLAFLHHGKIAALGTPAEVIKQFGRKDLEDMFIHFSRTQPAPETL